MATARSRSSTTIPVSCTCPFTVTTTEISSLAPEARLSAEPDPASATTSTLLGRVASARLWAMLNISPHLEP